MDKLFKHATFCEIEIFHPGRRSFSQAWGACDRLLTLVNVIVLGIDQSMPGGRDPETGGRTLAEQPVEDAMGRIAAIDEACLRQSGCRRIEFLS